MNNKRSYKKTIPIEQIWSFTIKEFRILCRDFEALALLFAMPVFFIVVMTLALEGVFEIGKEGHPIEIVSVNLDQGTIANGIVDDLQGLEILNLIELEGGIESQRGQAEELIGKKEYIAALIFPPEFSERVIKSIEGETKVKPTIIFIIDPASNRQILQAMQTAVAGIVEKGIMKLKLSASLERYSGNMISSLQSESGSSLIDQLGLTSEMAPMMKLVGIEEKLPSGHIMTRRPSAEEQNIPAYTIFGVFFIVLTIASSLHQEKTDGTFVRILTAPISGTVILLGKLIPYLAVNLVQILLMFLIGYFFFDVRPASLPAIVLVSIALALSANGLGLLVAAVTKTEAQINGLSILLAIALGALGGMMVPGFLMPGFMRKVSMFTPHAWALRGYHEVILHEMGARDVLLESCVLMSFALVFFVIALWRFRFHE